MKAKTVSAIIEAFSTGFGAFVEDESLPLTGYGKNVQLAKEDLATSLHEMIKFYSKKGEALPDAYNEGKIEFEYKYDIVSIFEHFGM